MSVLNDWQKITRVVSGKPFGDGSAGNATISADPATRASLTTVSSGNTAITIGSAILSNGDVFALYQARGTDVGQWEINKVASGGGGTSITCTNALNYTYTTSGASVAQVIKIPLYDSVTLDSFTVGAWAGATGGVTFICGRTSISGTGTLTFSGVVGGATNDGNDLTATGGAGKGFRGGDGYNNTTSFTPSQAAEGTSGAAVQQRTANGNGGGGGDNSNSDGAGGGGGGNGTAGADATGSAQTISGGGSVGTADLITMIFGGGGGGGFKGESNATAAGGGGGGVLVLISASVDVSGMTLITLNGGAGGVAGGTNATGGGGGAGGSCLLVCGSATLGTNLITATGGAGGNSAQYDGGAGGVGRIAVHHSGATSGTTNPTFNDQSDSTLIESGSGMFLVF